MKLLREAVQLHVRDAIINVLIHKYNVGDVILAETLPPNFTPLCIIYASKTNLFCEELVKRGIKPQTWYSWAAGWCVHQITSKGDFLVPKETINGMVSLTKMFLRGCLENVYWQHYLFAFWQSKDSTLQSEDLHYMFLLICLWLLVIVLVWQDHIWSRESDCFISFEEILILSSKEQSNSIFFCHCKQCFMKTDIMKWIDLIICENRQEQDPIGPSTGDEDVSHSLQQWMSTAEAMINCDGWLWWQVVMANSDSIQC